ARSRANGATGSIRLIRELYAGPQRASSQLGASASRARPAPGHLVHVEHGTTRANFVSRCWDAEIQVFGIPKLRYRRLTRTPKARNNDGYLHRPGTTGHRPEVVASAAHGTCVRRGHRLR